MNEALKNEPSISNEAHRRRRCIICVSLLVFLITLYPIAWIADWHARGYLVHAVRTGNYSQAQFLTRLDPFAAPGDCPDDLTHTTILSLALWENQTAIAKLLIRRGADVNRVNPHQLFGAGPLHFAAQFADADTTEALIRQGANVNAQNKFGETPLHLAAERGNVDIIKLLLASKADPNVRDDDHLLPIDRAQKSANKEAYAILNKYAAD